VLEHLSSCILFMSDQPACAHPPGWKGLRRGRPGYETGAEVGFECADGRMLTWRAISIWSLYDHWWP